MKIYLAGPMRGHHEHNFPEFYRVAERLREKGHEVFNPAENDNWRKSQGLPVTMRDLLGDDMVWICAYADAVALLDGWEHSKGAQAERATATALGLTVSGWRGF